MIYRHRLRSVALAVALVAIAAAAGCSSSGAGLTTGPTSGALPSASTPGSTSGSPSADPNAPPEPLTGLPGRALGAAIVVPIDLTPGVVPDGIAGADIVSVEFGEAGLIRLVGIFQSVSPSRVGPAGGVRPSDLKLIGQFLPVIAQHGGTNGVLDVAKQSHLAVRSAGAGFTMSGNSAYVDIDALRNSVKGAVAPPPMFTYAQSGRAVSVSGVKAATRVVIAVPGHAALTWTFDSARKLWQSTIGGAAVTTANLVILTTPYMTKHVSSLRKDLTYANPIGQGRAIIVSADSEIAATWYKKSPELAMNFLGPDQNTPQLTAGRTWIVLTPNGTKVTTS